MITRADWQIAAAVGYVVESDLSLLRDLKGIVDVDSKIPHGEGVYVTARHVDGGRQIVDVDFHDSSVVMELIQDFNRRYLDRPGNVRILAGPDYHPDPTVDVACFRLDYVPADSIPLGGHFATI